MTGRLYYNGLDTTWSRILKMLERLNQLDSDVSLPGGWEANRPPEVLESSPVVNRRGNSQGSWSHNSRTPSLGFDRAHGYRQLGD